MFLCLDRPELSDKKYTTFTKVFFLNFMVPFAVLTFVFFLNFNINVFTLVPWTLRTLCLGDDIWGIVGVFISVSNWYIYVIPSVAFLTLVVCALITLIFLLLRGAKGRFTGS